MHLHTRLISICINRDRYAIGFRITRNRNDFAICLPFHVRAYVLIGR